MEHYISALTAAGHRCGGNDGYKNYIKCLIFCVGKGLYFQNCLKNRRLIMQKHKIVIGCIPNTLELEVSNFLMKEFSLESEYKLVPADIVKKEGDKIIREGYDHCDHEFIIVEIPKVLVKRIESSVNNFIDGMMAQDAYTSCLFFDKALSVSKGQKVDVKDSLDDLVHDIGPVRDLNKDNDVD